MMTKQWIRRSILGFFVAASLALAVFWNKPVSLQPPIRYMAPPPGFGESPVEFGTPAADCLFECILADPNVRANGLGFTVISHGWLEKENWYRDLALALRDKTKEPWLFAWYDWRNQSKHINPTEVARLARFQLGPDLGHHISDTELPITHVHLIGHSAGSWLINEAAKVIAQQRDTSIHLTFLDAYVPPGWDVGELGNVNPDPNDPNRTIWSDHYTTADHTLAFTHQPLKHAYNVDLTAIAHGINRHRFPFYWYEATVIGHYPRRKYADQPVVNRIGNLRVGYDLTREAGADNWQHALTCVTGNEPTDLEEPKD